MDAMTSATPGSIFCDRCQYLHFATYVCLGEATATLALLFACYDKNHGTESFY